MGLVPGAAAAPGAIPAASIDRQVNDARSELTAASKAVEDANRALEKVTAQIPRAEAEVARAKQAAEQARAAQAAAEEALVQARKQVAEQQAHIAEVQARIDELIKQIGALARQAYISGGEPRAIEILLQTTDPTDFSLQLESQRRTARSNGSLFDKTTAAREELARQLVTLKQLQAQAAEDEAQAVRQAAAAQAARDAAVVAEQQLKEAAAARETAAAEADSKRRDAKSVYQKLLAEQARVHGYARTTGTLRGGGEAVAWAMNYLGKGEFYDGLCLGFVDDAFGAPGGSRMPTAIAQWYRAVEAGKAHPRDRNPPIGAQVFWWSGNPARHIALYAGNGMIISTGVDGDRVGMRPMEYLDSYGPYLGWAEPYYG